MTEGAVSVDKGAAPDKESEYPGKFTCGPKITSINGAAGHV